jgi:hypothetical protein
MLCASAYVFEPSTELTGMCDILKTNVKLGIRSCDYFVMEIDSLLKKVIFLA